MKKKILLLGSTGSIGRSSLNIIRNYKSKLEIVALSTNKNIRLIIKQSKEFKVKNLIINDFESYKKILNYGLNKKIRIFNNISDFLKINKKKFDVTIVGISGFDGLDPTLKVIPYSRNLSSANKESIICGWKFINRRLKKSKTVIGLLRIPASLKIGIKNKQRTKIKKFLSILVSYTILLYKLVLCSIFLFSKDILLSKLFKFFLYFSYNLELSE